MNGFHYGCTKSPQRMSDAGSIPATSTTAGVHGFDGMLSVDGQPAMVPAASGSAKSRRPVRWARHELPTTTAITSRFCALRDVPHGRGVTKAVRVVPATRGASFNGANAGADRRHIVSRCAEERRHAPAPAMPEISAGRSTISPMPACAHGSDRQLRGMGRCDLSGASRLKAQKRTCGPVRERGAFPHAVSNGKCPEHGGGIVSRQARECRDNPYTNGNAPEMTTGYAHKALSPAVRWSAMTAPTLRPAAPRECIQTTRDLRLRRQMQAKLAELIAEENRRFTEGLPF